jgi:hypothetical protein
VTAAQAWRLDTVSNNETTGKLATWISESYCSHFTRVETSVIRLWDRKQEHSRKKNGTFHSTKLLFHNLRSPKEQCFSALHYSPQAPAMHIRVENGSLKIIEAPDLPIIRPGSACSAASRVQGSSGRVSSARRQSRVSTTRISVFSGISGEGVVSAGEFGSQIPDKSPTDSSKDSRGAAVLELERFMKEFEHSSNRDDSMKRVLRSVSTASSFPSRSDDDSPTRSQAPHRHDSSGSGNAATVVDVVVTISPQALQPMP